MNLFRNIVLTSSLVACMAANAAAPSGYYKQCENKSGAALLSALCSVVGPHTVVSYDGLWDVYKTSDVYPNGKLWDMYSTKQWTPGQNVCGNYKNVGDCVNREHSFPKSWFNDKAPMESDAYHLYPTDGRVNGQRGNYPYGECARGTTLPSSGGVQALGRLGTSTFSGYSGTVFEPDDEYKGDFARTYFYMAAAYNDKIAGWDSPMLAGNSYPAFDSWVVEMLLKWHRQDPVSDKELKRNDAVYAYQKNRNPFIDNPEMAEYIWGDKKNESWTSEAGAQPALLTPVNNSVVNLGTVAVGVARSYKINVKGTALKNNVTVSLADANGVFTVSPSTLKASDLNLSAGADLTLTVNAKAATDYTATLTLKSSDGVNTTVTLSAKAMTGLPISEPTHITDRSFIVHWTYVGDADADDCYSLYVTDAEAEVLEGYPLRVNARDEAYNVENLEPETEYLFYITNGILKSPMFSVTTAAPMPNIQIYYDADLYGERLELSTQPGVPSEPVELLVEIDNIYDNVTFSVSEPFQLSSDKGFWDTSLVISPDEDRIYLRLFSDSEGSFVSSISAASGEYVNDNAQVTGQVYAGNAFFEDFESGNTTNGYSSTKYVGNAGEWKLTDAGVYNIKGEQYDGTYYLRLGKTKTSAIEMADDKTGGLGVVTFMACGWSSADGETTLAVEYSADGGETWKEAGTVNLPAPTTTAKVYDEYNVTVNCPGKTRLRLRQTAGSRACIDNISATNYISSVADSFGFADEHGTGWDAWSADSRLTVSISQDATVAVHGVDGITYVNSNLAAGEHAFDLPKGLYIVVVGQSTRRVLVK